MLLGSLMVLLFFVSNGVLGIRRFPGFLHPRNLWVPSNQMMEQLHHLGQLNRSIGGLIVRIASRISGRMFNAGYTGSSCSGAYER